MNYKLVEKGRLADLLRKERQLAYLQRVVGGDAMTRANRLLVDYDEITLLDEIKKDDDYWTGLFPSYNPIVVNDDSDINCEEYVDIVKTKE